MTNAEKYEEVFGFSVDTISCPTEKCRDCPCVSDQACSVYRCRAWWNKEYEGNDTVKVEVTEVHTFAKPDDVSGIKFGD